MNVIFTFALLVLHENEVSLVLFLYLRLWLIAF